MLFFDFKNYEEFQERFGIIEHGNGVKSRKNKILLALYKDKQHFRNLIIARRYETLKYLRRWAYWRRESMLDWHKANSKVHENLITGTFCFYDREYRNRPDLDIAASFYGCDDLQKLQNRIKGVLTESDCYSSDCTHRLYLGCTRMYSNKYETDIMDGICEDGTLNSIRYVNMENNRVFKMRAGRMLNHVFELNFITRDLPEEIKRWYSEMFVADWIEYVRAKTKTPEYSLHIDDNFGDIYNTECCAGYDEDSDSFGSCMVDDGQHYFYKNSVSAKAAYLTDDDGMIVARCIIYTDVTDQDGKKYRLAERQYSKGCEPSLQRQLVAALIREKAIDGFKLVGASCHAPHDFVNVNGDSLSDRNFWIPCDLNDGDTLSYQDSFKWYNLDKKIAYNYEEAGSYQCLDTTSEEFDSCWCEPEDDHSSDEWSDYHDCYIPSEDALYVETRGDWFYESECEEAKIRRSDGSYYFEWCKGSDCVSINGDYYYAGQDCEDCEEYGIGMCPECDDYFLLSEGCHSELTDEYYCCDDCMESGEEKWHRDRGDIFSDYDDEWYEDCEDVIKVREWICGKYYDTTISVDSFNSLVENGEATMFNGSYYLDSVNLEGEPAHFFQDAGAVA